VDLAAEDMNALGLRDGDLVRVRSSRGSLVIAVAASAELAPGQAFIPMHWGEEVLGGVDPVHGASLGVNGLTSPALCPQSRQPELKHCAIAIEPAGLPWRLTALSWLPQDRALTVRERLKPLLKPLGWTCLLPFGREPDPGERLGLVLRAGAARAPDPGLLLQLRVLLGLDRDGVLTYDDPRGGRSRALRLRRGADGDHLDAIWLAGDPGGEDWLRSLLEADAALPCAPRLLLAPGELARGLAAAPVPARQICSCHDVREDAIRAAFDRHAGDAAQRLAGVVAELRCGTQCGSCLPTLRDMARTAAAAAPAVA
jgi:assimilatory nitrate reductase catalytic subunit